MLDWDAIDHVLLDMDGTILDLSFDSRFWLELMPARYAAIRGLTLEQACAELEPQFRQTQGLLEWYCLDHWGAVTGLDLVALKREVAHWIAPLEGAVEFLEAVREHGKSLWLVTNAHRGGLELKMARTGLGEYFERIVSSHDFAAPKEHPDFWAKLAAAFPFARERTLFVDDSLAVLQAADAYGIAEVVAIARPDSRLPPREVIGFRAVAALAELKPARKARAE